MSLDDYYDLGDCSLIKLRYKIGGEFYVLTEATGDVACKRSDRIFRSANFTKDGEVSVTKSIADLEPWLVSLCLVEEATGNRVAESTIRSWSSRIQKRLYNDLARISEFDSESEQEDQKESSSEEPSSSLPETPTGEGEASGNE